MQKLEQWINQKTPESVKRALGSFLDRLPKGLGRWIREHKTLSIVLFFAIRGLFFRPSMWVLYAAAFAYFFPK